MPYLARTRGLAEQAIFNFEIRTPDPQIRGLMLCACALARSREWLIRAGAVAHKRFVIDSNRSDCCVGWPEYNIERTVVYGVCAV
jgi:hypothetical protein